MPDSCSNKSRSRSPISKSKRKSGSPSAAKKRGRPRTRPIQSPREIKKRGRPKRGAVTISKEIIQHDSQTRKNLTLPSSFIKKKDVEVEDDESEEERNYDPDIIDTTTRVLRNQAQIDADRIQCRRSNIIQPSSLPNVSQQKLTYNATQPPIQPDRNFPMKQNDKENSEDIARLLMLTPYDFTQANFASQELVRLTIKRKLLKKLVEISWSTISTLQLPYNIINYYFQKLGGSINIKEEFNSFSQLDGYIDEKEQDQYEIPTATTVYEGNEYPYAYPTEIDPANIVNIAEGDFEAYYAPFAEDIEEEKRNADDMLDFLLQT